MCLPANDGSALAVDGHPPNATSAQSTVFAALHREHARGIYNLALRLLRHHQDAEDVTQEVLLKLFLHCPAHETVDRFGILERPGDIIFDESPPREPRAAPCSVP